ncbi:hypothetical protein F0L68_40375 [Solihabitans fulvus]|uniref:Uncharacterized protein n=1 Tax=Solihabitans fulvus TaxID=1892852 RepID=A0A5B2W9G1_9PSEU|nr:hypothetical protein [Solihabitans fulvus]KAA2247176.1 hypothetical protein F0L68_40375 [Solihabitans fulvus]
MFGSSRRHRVEPPAVLGDAPTVAAPGSAAGRPPLEHTHELVEAAPLYTVAMPYDVAADHEAIMVFVTEIGPATALTDMVANCLRRLAQEASRRGCDAVYGVQQSMAADAGQIFLSLLGTGARPIHDLDRPPPLPGA